MALLIFNQKALDLQMSGIFLVEAIKPPLPKCTLLTLSLWLFQNLVHFISQVTTFKIHLAFVHLLSPNGCV